jgi:hypothetical protein
MAKLTLLSRYVAILQVGKLSDRQRPVTASVTLRLLHLTWENSVDSAARRVSFFVLVDLLGTMLSLLPLLILPRFFTRRLLCQRSKYPQKAEGRMESGRSSVQVDSTTPRPK